MEAKLCDENTHRQSEDFPQILYCTIKVHEYQKVFLHALESIEVNAAEFNKCKLGEGFEG